MKKHGKKIYVNSNISKEYRGLEKLKDEERTDIIKNIMENIYIAVHNKIYKKELIDKTFKENDVFINGMYYEDIVYTYSILQNINSITSVNKPLYYYVQRKSSISNNYDKRLFDILSSVDILIKNAKRNNVFEKYNDILEYIGIRYMYGTFMKRIAKTKDMKRYFDGYNLVLKKDNDIYNNYNILGKNKKNNRFLNNNSSSHNNFRTKLKNIILKNMDKKVFAFILYFLERNTKN
jgi:glycosyltransferase